MSIYYKLYTQHPATQRREIEPSTRHYHSDNSPPVEQADWHLRRRWIKELNLIGRTKSGGVDWMQFLAAVL